MYVCVGMCVCAAIIFYVLITVELEAEANVNLWWNRPGGGKAAVCAAACQRRSSMGATRGAQGLYPLMHARQRASKPSNDLVYRVLLW